MIRTAGFTLLEILVALVVFGVLLAGLTQGTRYGLQAWQKQVSLSDRNSDEDAVDRALRHMIEMMDPGDGADGAPVSANRERMDFVTSLPGAATSERRVEAALFLDADHRLVLRWRPWLHARRLRPAPPPTDVVLLGGLAGLDLSFWQAKGGWVADWHGPDLPALVRIRLRFPPGSGRRWPDIVAAPALDAP